MKCPRIENCPMYCECHGDIPDSPSWKSVRDGLPRDGQYVIMWVPGEGIDGGYIFEGCFIHDYFYTPDGKEKNAKYWMPRISPFGKEPKPIGDNPPKPWTPPEFIPPEVKE